MTKLEFMKELESLLSDIPLEERNEALQYYNGYFEDAGEEHEEEIIKELGSPKRVAAIIKADLGANAQDRENRGCFTENGYKDTSIEDERYELMGMGKKNADQKQTDSSAQGAAYQNNSYQNNTYQNHTYQQGTNNGSPNGTGSAYGGTNAGVNKNGTNIALIIIICLFGGPLIIAAFGTVVGILASIIGIIIGFGAAGIAMIIGGIALIVAGFLQISVPLMGLLFCGSGLLLLGLGMLFTLACVALCKSVLPAMIKGIVNICRKPFQNRSVTA